MKILFLDVDGVLNDFKTVDKVYESCGVVYDGVDLSKLKRLNKIIKTTGAKIVLSTTWRKYDVFVEHLYKRMFIVDPELPLAIIGETPVLEWKLRSDEIDDWLSKHPEVTHFVVLDDLTCEGLDKYGCNFVLTQASKGLTTKLMNKCIELLT